MRTDPSSRGMPRSGRASNNPVRSDRIHKKENVKNLEKKLEKETIFREMVEDLYTSGNEEEFFEILCRKMKQLGYHEVILGLFDEQNRSLTLLKMEGLNPLTSVDMQEEKDIFSSWVRKESFVSDDIGVTKKVTTVSVSEVHAFIPLEIKGSLIGVPLGDNPLGGLVVTGTLNEDDIPFLKRLGETAGTALQKMRDCTAREQQMEEVTVSLNQFHLLQEINNALNSSMDLEYILQILVKGLHVVFGYETPSVYLLSEDKKSLVVKEYYINSNLVEKVRRLVGFQLRGYHIPLFEGSQLKRAITTGTPLITGNIPRILTDFTNSEPMRKLAVPMFKLGNVKWLAALPLIANNEPVGMLVVTKKDEIKPEDVADLGGFLQQASLAIKRAELHSKLEESLERVKEADQMKSRFIDIFSHELRTPLTSLRLYLEMIQMEKYGEISEELQEKVLLLQEATDRLQEIIDQTLTSSRILKEKLILNKTEVFPQEVIEEVVSCLKPLWEEKNQHITVEYDSFPAVPADRDALRKVVNALLGNAIKYSEKGSTITVEICDNPEEVIVAVSDEGMGIPPEYQEKIFEEFFIVPSRMEFARLDGRTGLGLFIARGIVENHGGRIWVESGLKGSTFCFTLPKSGDVY